MFVQHLQAHHVVHLRAALSRAWWKSWCPPQRGPPGATEPPPPRDPNRAPMTLRTDGKVTTSGLWLFIGGKGYPDAPCMEYLRTFRSLLLGHVISNVDTYTIHGASGLCIS